MQFDHQEAREYLRESEFENLFTQVLGWDNRSQTQPVLVTVDEIDYVLNAIAHKRGMVVYECPQPADQQSIPNYATRRKIQKEVARSSHENFVIYTNTDKSTQIWQWVKREQGRPDACREHRYENWQSGESLIQKLKSIVFTLEEEEELTLSDVLGQVHGGFDVERVTRRFYDHFKKEHDAFLKFLTGIPDEDMQKWYVSVMLNRLMFIYFIQKKGFLNDDINYLRNKLTEMQSDDTDKYYKEFLCPLFFEGFAKPENERSLEMKRLLGKIPYLNGGIFQKHQLETQHGEDIVIPDAAFEKLFTFFEQYQWTLDDRQLRNDNEINPDVLGYIFEKYINQKQMGAYYTKEDITEYISKNTIIPFLFDTARQECKIAFEGDASVWKLLQEDPDRYIYDAVKKGVNIPLPEEIAIGIDDVSKRTEWNTLAHEEYALPTEIWRETVARQQRYRTIKSKMENGELDNINDLITYNLNIRQFAQDVIENCEGPELLRAFWKAITKVTILDPTCGSGAFLFAALNILEPLYEACLDRMQVFLDEVGAISESRPNQVGAISESRPSRKYKDFRQTLDRIAEHPNRDYFVLKSIIIHNLYGVDIMEEAIEICKLRLFLKMVAQLDDVKKIEPLPDIDFNIQAGNALVGFATDEDIENAIFERSCDLLQSYGWKSMIIPHSAYCTDRMSSFQSLFHSSKQIGWIQTYATSPSKLFVGANQRLAIYIMKHKCSEFASLLYTSRYNRWHEEFREYILDVVEHVDVTHFQFKNSIPKLYSEIEQSLWIKCTEFSVLGMHLATRRDSNTVYFHNSPRYWIRAMDFVPYFWNERDGERTSTQVKPLYFDSQLDAMSIVATLNSTFFYWWYVILSDCRHLNLREIKHFPIGVDRIDSTIKRNLSTVVDDLMADLRHHSQRREAYYRTTGKVIYDEFFPRYSKDIIDGIDRLLAEHYGFTDEELDFIINYDIKYRMGLGN